MVPFSRAGEDNRCTVMRCNSKINCSKQFFRHVIILAPIVLLGSFIFSGISGLVAHAGRHNPKGVEEEDCLEWGGMKPGRIEGRGQTEPKSKTIRGGQLKELLGISKVATPNPPTEPRKLETPKVHFKVC